MYEITPERQAVARARLVGWAHNDHGQGYSMLEWLENKEVLNYVYDYELDPKLLEHIAYWVWKPLGRDK